jgi:hypothetical protein
MALYSFWYIVAPFMHGYRGTCDSLCISDPVLPKRLASQFLHELTKCSGYSRGINNRYSETNVMFIMFNVLRIKSLYMFPALLAHPQEVLDKRHLLYYVRVMSVGSTGRVEPTDITRTQYTKCRLCATP